MRIAARTRPPMDMAWRPSDTLKLRLSPTNCGKLEVVQKDRRKKTGTMPPNNCDPLPTPGDSASGDRACPKCGVEMEPIDVEVEGLRVQELQLCPSCYLVTWSDQDGPHVRQGVPMKTGVHPGDLGWSAGEPEEC